MNFSEIISEGARALKGGRVILYPTDTIWGIGGDSQNPEVIEKIYRIKQRPNSKALVHLVSDVEMLKRMTTVSELS